MKIDKEKLKPAICWVLEELAKEKTATQDSNIVTFKFSSSAEKAQKAIPRRDQKRALKFLQKEKAIEVKKKIYASPYARLLATTRKLTAGISGKNKIKPEGYNVKIEEPKFSELLDEYEQDFLLSREDIEFDKQESKLRLGEHSILVEGKNQSELLNIIFENKDQTFKKWYFSEIQKNFEGTETKQHDEKWYQAAYQISKKIAAETRFSDDFVDTHDHYMKFNSKYLK